MTIIVIPNLSCNIKCKYCFAHGYGWVNEHKIEYNLNAILKGMEEMHKITGGDNFCMHGGECTVISFKDFEAILSKMFELQGKSAVQSNGYTLNNDFIRLFKKYKTGPGVSIDGTGELNSLRGFPDDKVKNREFTEKVLDNMFTMRKEGINVGVITLLHKVNAGTPAKLRKLRDFLFMLKDNGITGGRLNLMWSNYPEVKQYELTPEEASRALVYLYNEVGKEPELHWNHFREMIDNLLGFHLSSCSFGKCDYFCTTGAKSILPDGSFGNCDRTHQEGVVYTRASNSPTFERYEVLKETDCSECRYWNVCYGGCPSEGVDSDWRNKTRWCKPIYDLYSVIEKDIKGIFPNIRLVTDNAGVDNFELLQRGNHINPFDSMLWDKSKYPSAWKSVTRRTDVVQDRQNADCRHGNVDHGDYTDHGDS